jgi:hypothetical protein
MFQPNLEEVHPQIGIRLNMHALAFVRTVHELKKYVAHAMVICSMFSANVKRIRPNISDRLTMFTLAVREHKEYVAHANYSA